MKSLSVLGAMIVTIAFGTRVLQVAAHSPESDASATAATADFPAPADRMQTMLIRNTLTAVNHGVLTGNYTVLRDLATESFRQVNQAGDLAARFAPLRKQKLDLSPTLITEPQLVRAAETTTDHLKLVGLFPTRPRRIEFTLLFQRANGGWMIHEIAINVAPAGNVLANVPVTP